MQKCVTHFCVVPKIVYLCSKIKIMNPFSYGTIVKGGNFYNRSEESTRIFNTLSGGNNVVLYAPRRFGKTSLIFKVIEQLEEANFICIYFDFMPVFSPESFFRLYTKALSAKQSNLNKFASLFSSIIKTIRPVLNYYEKINDFLCNSFNCSYQWGSCSERPYRKAIDVI